MAATLPKPSIASVKDALSDIKGLSEQTSAVIEALKGIPEEVITFLQRATVGQARLVHLTTSVHEWLSREKLVDNIRIALD